MNKFIIFKLKEITPSGDFVSDDGLGIEAISAPVDRIAYMTASSGSVNIFLRDVSPYEDNNLSTGESLQRSFVTVSCEEGSEIELMKSISVFSNSNTSNPFLMFDATASPTFGRYGESIKAFVRSNPVNRVTGVESRLTDGSFTASTAASVGDVDFGAVDNKPILDLDCRDATYSGTLTAWANQGTGGSTYDVDVASSVGSIFEGTGNSTNGFNTNPVSIPFDGYAVLSNALTVTGDYTIYAVFTSGLDGSDGVNGVLYGSSSGESVGFCATNESTDKQPTVANVVGFRHEERLGLPAISEVSVPFDKQLPSVIVIRRDKDFNLSVYNYEGVLIASIPSNVYGKTGTIIIDGETSGDLNILQIGSAGSNTTSGYKGPLGRFGVIDRDIGQSSASRLARDLHQLYKL
jgi:hypothetical protein